MFKRLLIRFERYDACFLGAHYLAFALINLRHVLAQEVDDADHGLHSAVRTAEIAS